MNSSIKSKVAGQAGGLAQQAMRQVAQEPWEVLKSGASQVAGMEKTVAQPPNPSQPVQAQNAPAPVDIEALKQQDQAHSQQLHENLEKEIKEIGQKQQQERAIKLQAQAQAAVPPEQKIKPLERIATKPSRKLFSFGPKTSAERKKTRVERVQSPSG